jgi:hypothetical protein
LEQADEIAGRILIVDREIARQIAAVSAKYCAAMKDGRRNPKVCFSRSKV